MQVPLLRTTAVRVPYLSSDQTPGLTKAINTIVRQMRITTTQRTVPLNVRRAFESTANKQALQTGKPPCTCTPDVLPIWEAAGTVGRIRGHFFLLPVALLHNGVTLCSTDPLPLPSNKCHQAALSSLRKLAKTLDVPPLSHAYLQKHLPATWFTESGELRQRVRQVTAALAPHAVTRVVDKGPGTLWGFCRAWAWDELQHFMNQQGYTQESQTAESIFRDIQDLANGRGGL